MGALDLPQAGLTEGQWEQLNALARSLNTEQALWVSGYLAGVGAAARAAVEMMPRPLTPVAPIAPAAPLRERTLTILYGTETDNSARIARTLEDAARKLGLAPKLVDMGDYKPRQLKDEQDLLIVVSTHGEGDPPQSAAEFFEFVEGRRAPALPQLRFAVLALGDSSYEHYCEAGKRLDRRLEALQAKRIQPRIDCDVDYEQAAAQWTASVLEQVASERQAKPRPTLVPVPGADVAVAERPAATQGGRAQPECVEVIENLVLTGRGSSKETRHVELDISGAALRFEPGDALGIVTPNDPAVAAALLGAVGISPGDTVTLKERVLPAIEALERELEITLATPRFLAHWAKLSGSAELAGLCRDEAAAKRTDFLRNHHIVDIVRRYPAPGIDAQTFIAGLRPLQPRLYSIASSLSAIPGEAHLTVASVRYRLHDEERLGVASTHIARCVPADSTLPVYVQPNPHFRLPAVGTPIVMIGAGTGIAPYRAFLQEREARGDPGRSWLIFGERNFATDFLYQTEWQALLKKGVLSRMTVAFSRDQAAKVYVQHRMRSQARELYAWLQEGAHLYVCGDAAELAPAVHEALLAIVAEQSGRDREAAQGYLRELQRARRYQRDVY